MGGYETSDKAEPQPGEVWEAYEETCPSCNTRLCILQIRKDGNQCIDRYCSECNKRIFWLYVRINKVAVKGAA